MQRFPTCRTCGRPIDFIDVKLSRSWPQYCCVECKKSVQGKINYDRHASKIYERMLNSEWIRPLFTLEDFRNADRRTHCFDVKCSKCGGIFSLPFNLNFYARTGKKTGKGVFTITQTKSGTGSKAGWGKLKSGEGWISLDYAKRI